MKDWAEAFAMLVFLVLAILIILPVLLIAGLIAGLDQWCDFVEYVWKVAKEEWRQ